MDSCSPLVCDRLKTERLGNKIHKTHNINSHSGGPSSIHIDVFMFIEFSTGVSSGPS